MESEKASVGRGKAQLFPLQGGEGKAKSSKSLQGFPKSSYHGNGDANNLSLLWNKPDCVKFKTAYE